MMYLKHKGYTGTIEYSKEDKLLFGKVLGIQGMLSYEGETGAELEEDFIKVIDEYLADCAEVGKIAETPSQEFIEKLASSNL